MADSKGITDEILGVKRLGYSNLYEHFRSKLQDFIKCNQRSLHYDNEQSLLFGEASGAGGGPEKIVWHTIRVEQLQLNHFLEFTMRSYYYQDVA